MRVSCCQSLSPVVREAAEFEMREWVAQYLEEMQKIEIFFNTKFLEYSHELEMLKHSFSKKRYGSHYKQPRPIHQHRLQYATTYQSSSQTLI